MSKRGSLTNDEPEISEINLGYRKLGAYGYACNLDVLTFVKE